MTFSHTGYGLLLEIITKIHRVNTYKHTSDKKKNAHVGFHIEGLFLTCFQHYINLLRYTSNNRTPMKYSYISSYSMLNVSIIHFIFDFDFFAVDRKFLSEMLYN